MIFSSITFLFYFLPIVLGIYYITPKKYKNIVLFISSILFYFFGEPKYVFLILSSILSAYIFGLLIEKYNNTKYQKIITIIAISVHVLLLIYFKYTDFIIQNINLFLTSKIDLLHIILPIGISFYTFQIISYIIDVYRGDVKAQKNILTLATYVSLFPQLIAGPIVRYQDVEEELRERKYTIQDFSLGIRRFCIGLAKKVMIANVLGELVEIFLVSNDKSVLFYWIYGIAIMLQIYFDFSGYSDMAIGLGKMFGFHFLENFNYPYIATSITEFWRRWHISLSKWFRDYVYIPLGGNRCGKFKTFRNIMIVWILTGLWHGASWNFILWGLYFGILLVIEKKFLLKYLNKIPNVVSVLYTCFIVMISFMIFNSNNITQIVDNIKGLFGVGNIPLVSPETMYYLKSYFVVIIIGVISATPILSKILTSKKIEKFSKYMEPIFLMGMFVICVSYIIDGSFNPFLYFRF